MHLPAKAEANIPLFDQTDNPDQERYHYSIYGSSHSGNRIPIPCHKGIGKDRNLTGYGGGLERKKWLLEHKQIYSN